MTITQFLSQHLFQMVLLPALLALSGFFSAAETAMFNLSRAQLYRLRHEGGVGKVISSLMKRPRRVLNTLLLGNMLVNICYAAIAAVVVLDMAGLGLPAWGSAVLSLLPVLVLILVGELVPKTLALVSGEKLARLLAPPLALVQKTLGPVLAVMEWALVTPLTRLIAPQKSQQNHVTADELAALVELSARRGVIDLEANTLLQEIVALTDIRAADIMVPRVDVIAVDASDPSESVVQTFRKCRLRRIPVYEGDMDHILGVVHAKRLLLNPGRPLRELVSKVPFVPEAANIERVLLQLRVNRAQVAIVVDEFGGTAGLVTLEDVLEEIVGDIPDPHMPPRQLVERISQHEYLVDGELSVHQWADVFGTDLQAGGVSTMGGFVTSLLGRIARVGDVANYRNLRFTVESMRGHRIEKLRLSLTEEAA